MAKARATLEQGRLRNSKADALWLAAVRTELRAHNHKAAETLMAKALQVRGVGCRRCCLRGFGVVGVCGGAPAGI